MLHLFSRKTSSRSLFIITCEHLDARKFDSVANRSVFWQLHFNFLLSLVDMMMFPPLLIKLSGKDVPGHKIKRGLAVSERNDEIE